MRGKKSNEDNIFKDPNMSYHWVSFSLPQQTMTLFLPFYYWGDYGRSEWQDVVLEIVWV